MEPITTYRSSAENQRVYDLIWSQMPHMQNRTSTSWWFIMLFPRDGEEFGRRQLMFSITTAIGNSVCINDVWYKGVDLKRPVQNGNDRFPAVSVGWYCDGETVHDDQFNLLAQVDASMPDGRISCWTAQENGHDIGIDMRKSISRPLALDFRVRGKEIGGLFEAWGDLDGLHSSPHESVDIDTPLGGTHFIAWRRMNFEGEFDLPTGREKLDGIAYFQRVCLNIPMFPWKWIWAVFPDGSIFSAYVPYLGYNLFRNGYRYFDSNRKEQAHLNFAAAGFWDWPGSSEQILFNKARIVPVVNHGPHADFLVQVSNNKGDFLSFVASPFGKTRNYLDRHLLGGRLTSHWDYNEYLFRMEQLAGRISGRPITRESIGQGYGTLEYTYGLGL